VLAAARDESQPERVHRALGELRDEILRHNDHEERVLAAMLFDAAAAGPRRVERMTREHAAQHAALVALIEDAAAGARSMLELADELVWFAEGLNRDLEDEESALLRDDALGIATVAPTG
jgi:hypothetical protein